MECLYNFFGNCLFIRVSQVPIQLNLETIVCDAGSNQNCVDHESPFDHKLVAELPPDSKEIDLVVHHRVLGITKSIRVGYIAYNLK